MNREAVSKHKLFKGIESDSLERMLKCSKSRYKKYCKGQMIFGQEDPGSILYILLSGRVAIARQSISGRKNVLYEVTENHVFGENCIFGEDSVYQYGAEASTDVEVLEMPASFFYNFCSDTCCHHHQLIRNMLSILAAKEWLSVKKLNVVSASSLKERISIWLMDEVDEKGVVQLKMNREELADYLGVARPSLSRALMKMQCEGVLEVGRSYIRILEFEKIENLCI